MKKKQIIIAAVAALLLISGASAYHFGGQYLSNLFNRYYSMSNYLSDESVEISDETDGDAILTPEEEEEMRLAAAAEVDPISGKEMDGIYSILLIGSDRRSKKWNGNSDAMVLMTLNSHTDTIYLTSFMRDLYADIPGYGVNKLNSSYAKGGGPLLSQTIEANYGVSVDNYAMVDFGTMIKIIDMLGGVDVKVSPEEVEVANDYIRDMCAENKSWKLDPEDFYLDAEGATHLNGIQAVAFQRIRYVGNADFGRTSRQRAVLQAIFKKLKSMRFSKVLELADEVVPLITHNVDETTARSLYKQIPLILGYDAEELRIPYDDSYYSRREILIPKDMTETITTLRDTIYAKSKSKITNNQIN